VPEALRLAHLITSAIKFWRLEKKALNNELLVQQTGNQTYNLQEF
jgi:hypothetical protein